MRKRVKWVSNSSSSALSRPSSSESRGAPPRVQPARQLAPQAARLLLARWADVDEEGVRVAVDDRRVPRLNPRPAFIEHLVPALRDRAREPRIEKATQRRAEDPVERIHQDLDGPGERGILHALRLVSRRPKHLDQAWDDVALPVERGAVEPRNRIAVRYVQA